MSGFIDTYLPLDEQERVALGTEINTLSGSEQLQGLRGGILTVLSSRFGPIELTARLEKISDMASLNTLLVTAVTIASPAEFQRRAFPDVEE